MGEWFLFVYQEMRLCHVFFQYSFIESTTSFPHILVWHFKNLQIGSIPFRFLINQILKSMNGLRDSRIKETMHLA